MFEKKKIVDWNSINVEWSSNSVWNIYNISIYTNTSEDKKIDLANTFWIQPKQEYIDIINKVDFVSTIKELTLEKTFVYPNFSFISKDWKEEDIDWNKDIFLDFTNKVSFIKWIELSGKTSIWRKIFIDSFQENIYTLFIDWDTISSWTNKYEKILKKSFEEQYNWDYDSFILNYNKKILIIDNYHHKISDSFLEYSKQFFSKIIFLVLDEEYMLYFRDKKNFADVDVYSIKFFNYTKQHNLISNWFKTDYWDEEEIYNKDFDIIENKIDDIITKNHIVPKIPFYILSIIQTFENLSPTNLQITSYWHCYNALITSQLIKKWINPTEIQDCYNYLTFLAYNIFALNKNWSENITLEQYNQIKADYWIKYIPLNSSILSRLENKEYPIIKISENVKFEFQYIYYYFVWKYLAEKKDENNDIEKLCVSIYKKSSSHILVFTIHHTDDNNILDEIQMHCMVSFENHSISELSTKETNFMTDIIRELPTTIIEKKSTWEKRINERKIKDEQEKNLKELDNEEIEKSDELMELNKSFKIIEVLWQILKNRAGSLEKEKVKELLLEVENLWLRLMTFLLWTIKSQDFFDSIERKIDIIEKEKELKNKYLSSDEKRKNIERFIQIMAMWTIHWILFKVFQSVWIDKLLLLQKDITKNNPYVSYELLNLLFNINFWKITIEYIKDLHKKYSDEKNTWAILSLSYFIQFYLNTHNDIDFRLRQQLSKLLWFDYTPNKLLAN